MVWHLVPNLERTQLLIDVTHLGYLGKHITGFDISAGHLISRFIPIPPILSPPFYGPEVLSSSTS
jgi:hypothetical protein